MAQLTISAVAQEVGLKTSAIRYYEEIGLLPRPQRVSGQRRYDPTVLYRLSVIQRAQRVGFTLHEIKRLFLGFESGARASDRWRKLSQKKLDELEKKMEEVVMMQKLLKRMASNCRCETLEQCGKAIFENAAKRPRQS
jgi:MerR family transcriptional regulator, redox-sensitive transcriptional activator SoxR